MPKANLMIVQGGGPTAVFNTSLASIVDEAQQQSYFGNIYGARFGMKGLANNDILELTSLSSEVLLQIRNSPGAALGSSRFKPTEDELERCIIHLRALDVRCMVFLGGNGTMGGAQAFSNFCAGRGYELQIMGAPKTIDNDINATDRCPGFGSAARYVAQSTLDLAMDIRALHQPVSIFETLGRDVGWLAASSILAKCGQDDAPHVICIPEIPFELDDFLTRIDATVARLGWAVAVVSEGTCYASGEPVFEQALPSKSNARLRPLIGGVAQHLSGLIAENLGLRSRSEKPGLIGRSAMAYISGQDMADADLTGRECVRALAKGKTDFMVSLLPLVDPISDGKFELLPLDIAAGARKNIPKAWLGFDGLAINEEFRKYLEPLVGALHYHPLPLSEQPPRSTP